MRSRRFSRRDILQGSAAVAVGAFAASAKVLAAAPPATAITPQLIEAAKKEGKVVYYTSIDLPIAERIAKAFEAKFPGIAVRVERTGAERVFQRIGQEYASRIHAVDVVNSSDAAHFIVWKRDGILQPFVPEDVAKHYPPEQKDPDGLFAGFRVGLSVIAYNTNLVKAAGRAEELRRSARSEMGRQDRQGASGLQRHHHDRDLPDDARARLGVSSRSSPSSASCRCSRPPIRPRSSRSASARCRPTATNTTCCRARRRTARSRSSIRPRARRVIVGPNGIFKAAPNPNAARLFQCYCFTPECQQLVVDVGKLRSMHPLAKETDGRKPFDEIKTMKEDAAAVEKMGEEIKARYSKLFGV